MPESHGFYPAITHFTDAIAALPRDYRRNTSLLKEVDAKAWALEENLQKLLKECLHERQTRPITSAAHTVNGSTSSVAGDAPAGSTTDSVNGNILDTASQHSGTTTDPDLLRRRRLYAELRNNLMQMIMPLDEKNHVINNANEELSRHIRRQDEIWPHITEEISEEARLGSLRHWALIDLNPTKKAQAAATRGREAAIAIAPDKDIAERSERRREAILAKKQKAAQHADSDIEARPVPRGKAVNASKLKQAEEDQTNGSQNVIGLLPSKQHKNKSSTTKFAENVLTKANAGQQHTAGAVTMSRENSQQGNSKKRKAPAAVTTVARKRYAISKITSTQTDLHSRINAATQESPKLGHSPLAGSFGKDAHKKSPALSSVRPVNGRGRQTSAQTVDNVNRPASSTSRRNGITANASDIEKVAASTGKTPHEVKQTMKETVNSKGDRMFEEDIPESVSNRIKGGILIERSSSRSSHLEREANEELSRRRTASPRLNAAALAENAKNGRHGKGKGKTSTPIVTTFAEGDASESAAEATSNAENGTESSSKPKRQARPRMKDHHGLHDSLSPQGLPTKRTHKKNGSYSLTAALGAARNTKNRDDDAPTVERKASSRTNSRSTKNNSQTDTGREARNASSTPKIGSQAAELVDEPDSISSSHDNNVHPPSRRQSQNPKNNHATHLDLKPPSSSRASTIPISNTTTNTTKLPSGTQTPGKISPLGSPGPGEHDDSGLADRLAGGDQDINHDADADVNDDEDDEDEEEDPNEDRYCYCNGVSYGEMVGCDNEHCAREWFHLECTGLRSLPAANAKWYCNECKGARAR